MYVMYVAEIRKYNISYHVGSVSELVQLKAKKTHGFKSCIVISVYQLDYTVDQ